MSRSVARAALFIALLVALTSCVTPEELRAQDEAACVSYGFQRGTPDFATCLQRESLARRYAPPPPDWGPGWGGPGWWGPGWQPFP
ncbi:MAG TPA: hypothetical protein VMA53_10380 [Stellaceae bacterium]|nr:hypothetical protein [Stellaceae bacterium]